MKTMKEYADEYARKHNVKITKVTDYSFVAEEYPKRDGKFPYKKELRRLVELLLQTVARLIRNELNAEDSSSA